MTVPYEQGRDTSEDAADSMREAAAAQKELVYNWGHSQGAEGWTDEECEIALGLRHQSASARRRSLYLEGRVVWTGEKRTNRSGRQAYVWVTDEVARLCQVAWKPLPTTHQDRYAFITMHCKVFDPYGERLRSKEDINDAIATWRMRRMGS